MLYGMHDFGDSGDTFKMALYNNSATFDGDTTAYTATNEISGTGYTAGGNVLTNINPTLTTGGISLLDFENVEWTGATLTARGLMIYNSTPNQSSLTRTNPSFLILDFGIDKSIVDGTLSIIFPTADSTNAIFRIE